MRFSPVVTTVALSTFISISLFAQSSFPPASGGGGSGSTTVSGTANQITVTGSVGGPYTLSFPAGGVTLPGTTALANPLAASTLPNAGVMTGDVTTTFPAITVAKVNGISYSATAAAHSIEIVTVANTTATATAINDCTGASKALTFAQSTDTFGCNTISGGSSAFSAITGSTNTTAAMLVGAGASLDFTSTGTINASSLGGSAAANYALLASPSFTTPALNVATATSINKVAITAPATSATLTILNGKTLTINKTLILDGSDSTTMTFPSTSATIARTDAANTFTGVQTMTSPALTTPAITTSATLSNNAIGVVSTDGFVLQNTTAAANNAQQWSPRLHWIGQGWNTAASQQVEWYAEAQPRQNSTNPAVQLTFKAIINGTATASPFTLCATGTGGGNQYILLDNSNNCGTGAGLTGLGTVNAASMFAWYANGTERGNIGVNGLFASSNQMYGWGSGTQGSTNAGDTGLARNAAGVVEANNGTACSSAAANCADFKLRHSVNSGTAPTLSSGTGTIAGADGAGRVTLTAGSQTTFTVTFGTAFAIKPVCTAVDETTAANNPILPTPTTTTVAFAATGTYGASDVIAFHCEGY